MKTDDKGRLQADKRVVALKTEAEIFCKRVGVDPNTEIKAPHPNLASVVINIPFWYSVANEMFHLTMMLRALKEGQILRQQAANDTPAPKEEPKEPSRIITS